MPKITDIKESQNNTENLDEQRVRVFVDGEFCTSIRARTFAKMKADGIAVGTEITCQRLKDKEKFFWKESYGADAWGKEKIRLGKVKTLIEEISPLIEATVVGFGADSTEFIARHPEMAGAPDLEVKLKEKDVVLLLVEVTGTETMRGDQNCYWVRPDKLKYVSQHPEKDIWIILHIAKPVERFVYIKPTKDKKYEYANIDIRNAGERMVEFRNTDPEVQSEQNFRSHLLEIASNGGRAIVADFDWFNPNKIAFVEVFAASYLGAFAGSNDMNSPDMLPFDKAMNMAVTAWERFSKFVSSKKTAEA